MNPKIENPQKGSLPQAETSTTPPNNPCDLILTDLKNSNAGERKKIARQQIRLPFSYGEFCELLIAEGSALLARKRQTAVFVIDMQSEPIIQQLYLYSIRSEEFNGDLNKGLMLQGKIGCGKSILLESYVSLLNRFILKFELRLPILRFIKAPELFDEIVQHGVKPYLLRPLVIDDFGRESKTSMNYGNITLPISELLHLRGDSGTLTHGTTNFSFDTLSSEEYYGQMIGDRLRLMFNFIVMQGDSRRK